MLEREEVVDERNDPDTGGAEAPVERASIRFGSVPHRVELEQDGAGFQMIEQEVAFDPGRARCSETSLDPPDCGTESEPTERCTDHES